MTMLEKAAPARDLLSGIGQLVPKAALVSMGETASLADVVGDFLRSVEDRLAIQAFREEVGASTPRSRAAKAASDIYYNRMRDTRVMVLRKSLDYFDKGFAMIGTTRGKAETLRGRAGPFDLPELAWIGRLVKGRSGQDYIVELVGVVCLFGWLNRWNDTMATPLEERPIAFGEKHLAKSGWDPAKHIA